MLFLLPILATAQAPPPQRPDNVPMCDFYTQALFQQNTVDNQKRLLVSLVNRVVAGNFTATANGIPVTGILATQQFNGTEVGLAKFFDGSQATTNVGGVPTRVNFFDDGGLAPLQQGLPSASSTTSKQFLLMTHLYSLFGELTGCTLQGQPEQPAPQQPQFQFTKYQGNPSMLETHKFMNLRKVDLDFFNDQVAKTALSFGVSERDANTVRDLLNNRFNQRCAAPIPLVPSITQPAFQSSCLSDLCDAGDLAQCAPGIATVPGQNNQPGQPGQPGQRVEINGRVNRVMRCVPKNRGQGQQPGQQGGQGQQPGQQGGQGQQPGQQGGQGQQPGQQGGQGQQPGQQGGQGQGQQGRQQGGGQPGQGNQGGQGGQGQQPGQQGRQPGQGQQPGQQPGQGQPGQQGQGQNRPQGNQQAPKQPHHGGNGNNGNGNAGKSPQAKSQQPQQPVIKDGSTRESTQAQR